MLIVVEDHKAFDLSNIYGIDFILIKTNLLLKGEFKKKNEYNYTLWLAYLIKKRMSLYPLKLN